MTISGDSGIGRSVAVMYALEGACGACHHAQALHYPILRLTADIYQYAAGADVAIVYLPEEEVDAQETKRLIVQAGQECITIAQDIREEEGCNRIVAQVVKAWGQIDILVNNASGKFLFPVE